MAEKLGNKKTWILSFVLCFLLCSMQMTMAGEDNTVTRAKELEAEKLLKKLNKPAVKSIKSPDGDMIDCVHILNQPAFDHPKLKNHKIQMRPTFYPERSNFSKSNPIAQLWHQSGNCPKGTIPIRRTTKDDILRAHSVQQFGKKITPTISNLSGPAAYNEGHEYAVADVRGDRYYGGKASISIWKPHVQQSNEFSLSQIWIMNSDDPNNLETIEAGWQIYPAKYGDDNPRLFVFWTNDSYGPNGCYDLDCPGFVQVDKSIAIGGSLQLSVEGGAQQELSILIYRDQGSGNWWMQVGSTRVGYWPASLYNRLSESASNVQWGGEIINKKSEGGQHTTTGMGSGNFPSAGPGKASYFKDISVVKGNDNLVSPNNYGTIVTNPKCYDISQYAHSDDLGVFFYYGGPGRNQESTPRRQSVLKICVFPQIKEI